MADDSGVSRNRLQLIRPANKRNDRLVMLASVILGISLGYGMSEKISFVVGVPFGIFASAILHFMWRSPAKAEM